VVFNVKLSTRLRVLQQQNPQLMKVNKMQRLDVDTVHPSFLGHYIAAERIAAWLAERPQLLQP